MTPYDLAIRDAAKAYDWRELERRNEAEGYGARRLADEYREEFMALFCERPWFQPPHVEIHRAALIDLQERIGPVQFARAAEAWKHEHLIRGVDYA